ncbi:MAG: outer membrane beta-barrel protein [Acidobacteriota bacterium]|nr:outer membrane beta-barrel protein [Acidobacteriota bacterium]
MKKPILAAAAFILLAAAFLSAQTYVSFRDEWEAVVHNAPWTLGPFRLFPSLSLRNVGYDDNIYFGVKREPDYTGTFSPELKVYLPIGGTILLSASENPEYTYYVRESARRSFDNSFSAGLKALLLSRFVLSGQYQDGSHRRQLSPEVGILVTDRSRGWDAGLSFETANQTVFGLTLYSHDLTFESYQADPGGLTLSEALNRTESGGRFEIDYRAFYKGYVFLGAETSEYEFDSTSMAWRNAVGRRYFAGARFPVGESIEGTVSLGYKEFRPRAEGQADFSGFVGSADLSARLGRIGLRARFGRDNVFSTYTDVLFFIDTTMGAGASFYLTDFIRLDYDFDVGVSDYSAAETGGAVDGRTDRHTTHAAGFVVRIFRTTGLGLTWNKAFWTSTVPGWDRQRSFIGAYLTYRF